MESDITTIAPLSSRTVALRTLAEVERFAELVHKTSLVPQEYRGKLGDVVGIIFFGLELSLNPIQALQGIMFVNGRPSVWGDTMLGLIRASGLLQGFKETEPDEAQATGIGRCTVTRKGEDPVTRVFTQAMAEKAGLWKKSGPWVQYPGRMLQMRARSWALRDVFADVLRGLYAREEAEDIVLSPDARGTWELPTGAAPRERPSAPAPEAPAAPTEPLSEPTVEASADSRTPAMAPAPLTAPPSLQRTFEGATPKQLEFYTSQLLRLAVPGDGPEDKPLRGAVLRACFDGLGWTKLIQLPVAKWVAGLAHLQLLGRVQHRLTELVTNQGPLAETERRDLLLDAFQVETFRDVVALPMDHVRRRLARLEAIASDDDDLPPDDAIGDATERTQVPPGERPIAEATYTQPMADDSTTGQAEAKNGYQGEGEEGPLVDAEWEDEAAPVGPGADRTQGEMPPLDAEGHVVSGEVEILRLWSQSKHQGPLFERLTQECLTADGTLILRPDQYINIRAAIEASV
jgi:hypothetical protein